jgi:hypothetical protein
MGTIDLNAARKARAAKREDVEPTTVEFGDLAFELPAEIPAEFAFAAGEGDLRAALAALFGDRAKDFFKENPSFDDVKELTEMVAKEYGLDSAGE